MKEMSGNLVVLTRQVCLGDFVTSPSMSVCSLAVWQRYWHPVSRASEMWFVSLDIKDIIRRWDSRPPAPPHFILWRNVIFKCNYHGLGKMTLSFNNLQSRIKFFRSEYSRYIAGNESDWLLQRKDFLLWPTYIFLNLRFNNIVRHAGMNSYVE